MLTSIEKISGLGVFDQYKKGNELKPFERYNVLYGMNGSGKTTLSRLFLSLNSGENEIYPELKYKVSSSNGKFEQGQAFPIKVRVFNSDYIASNIGEIEGLLNPIFIVGEENKALVSQIETDQKALAKLKDERTKKTCEKEKFKEDRGKRFTTIAKLIATDISGQVIRTYRKQNAEKAYSKIENFNVLGKQELDLHRATVRQSSLDKVEDLELEQVNIDKDGSIVRLSPVDAIPIIAEKARAICHLTSDSLAVQRLQEKPDIAVWVESGMALHTTHGSDTCEYCLQPIPQSRLDELAKHFNDSDRLLKENIEQLITKVKEVTCRIKELSIPIESQFYTELHNDCKGVAKALNNSRDEAFLHLNQILSALKDKLLRRTEAYESNITSYDESGFAESITAFSDICKRHNQKTEEFESHADKARKLIENHHLSTIQSEIEKFDSDIEILKDRLVAISKGDSENGETGIQELEERIAINQQSISNTVKAATRLTELLRTFLGRDDLNFEPEGDGYRIMRGSVAANRLSEGERTAITLIYFITQLNDQDFNLSESIIVIDDPVSSLDSNSTYQAFSFLKNAVKDAKQVFLLTHNFDFLKLLLNWCKNIPNSEGKKSYYMLLCNAVDDSKRLATIQPLDKQLSENESEYLFLFKQLYNFRSDGTIAGSYHIPNISRKVLETFLESYYPGNESLYHKLEHVDFDTYKKTALLKFANDLSHSTGKGFDPALIPETKNNVGYLLEMIKTVFPVHYKSLKQSIEAT